MSTSDAPDIKHVIVVMLENRSYDNVLGWLYNASNNPPYTVVDAPAGQANLNGLTGTETNPPVPRVQPLGVPINVMNQPTTTDGKTGQIYPGTTVPVYDPGELFSDMAQQILGGSPPASNPYDTATWPPDSDTLMQGFTPNYSQITEPVVIGVSPRVPDANVADVMNYLTPQQLPVTAWLANQFAVCDQWFASVPTQTFTNRAFAHCAAPAVHDGSFSLIEDAEYATDSIDELPSVFSQLDNFFKDSKTVKPPYWKVYFHDYSISTIVSPYVNTQAKSSDNINVATFDTSDWTDTPRPYPPDTLEELGNFKNMTTFLDDIDNLPPYSFIEPRYSNNYADSSNMPNSNHPGGAGYLNIVVSADNPPMDAADGEAFLLQLYNALCQSKCWASSLLIITYDEHGGLYDHVVPPAVPASAVPPGSNIPPPDDYDPVAQGFNYNVYGGRVPAIIVSPFVAPGSTISPPTGSATPFDHCSILKTVWDCFGVTDALTARDAAAPSIYASLSTANNTNPGQCPVKLGSNSEQQ